MSEVIPVQQLQNASTDSLKSALAQSLEITAKHLGYLAQIWWELERRGEDLSALRTGLMAYLPLIANQQIEADLVVKYAGQKTLLHALSQLDRSQQRQLIASDSVSVVRLNAEGQRYDELVSLSALGAQEVYRVFNEDHIRDPEMQYRMLLSRTERQRKRKTPPRRARKVEVDEEHRVLQVSNSAADLDRVLTVLSNYYGVDLQQLITQAKEPPSDA